MFESFSDRARKVLALANLEAGHFNNDWIGPEHLLLGLIKEGSGVAANVLKNLNVDLKTVRLEVERRIKAGPDMITVGRLPQAPSLKKVIEHALEESRTLNHTYVGTEHLLLGLLRQREGIAAEVLAGLGLTVERARKAVLELLREGLEKEATWPKGSQWDGVRLYAEAERAAKSLRHGYLGTEHFLLAVLEETESAAARVLGELGVDSAKVRLALAALGAPHPDSVGEKLPGVQRLRQSATRWVIQLGRDDARVESLLLGMLGDRDCAAAKLLTAMGLDLGVVRDRVLAQLNAGGGPKGGQP